jgi:hypothetical protein
MTVGGCTTATALARSASRLKIWDRNAGVTLGHGDLIPFQLGKQVANCQSAGRRRWPVRESTQDAGDVRAPVIETQDLYK